MADLITRLRAQCRCDANTCPMCEAADQLEQLRATAADIITIHTPACQVCGETSSVEVRRVDHHRWKAGDLIQQAFPEMPADQRELLQTGIHPTCWNTLFGEDND